MVPDLAPAFAASRAAREAEDDAMQAPELMHIRWSDLSAPARRALRRGRLAYLKALQELIPEPEQPAS